MALAKRSSSGDEGVLLLPSVVRCVNGNDENVFRTIRFDSSNFSNDNYSEFELSFDTLLCLLLDNLS